LRLLFPNRIGIYCHRRLPAVTVTMSDLILLHNLLDEVPLGIGVLDAKHRVVFVNRHLEALCGCSRASVAGLLILAGIAAISVRFRQHCSAAMARGDSVWRLTYHIRFLAAETGGIVRISFPLDLPAHPSHPPQRAMPPELAGRIAPA